MSHATELFCNIHFQSKTYDTLYKVEAEIEDLRSLVDLMKSRLAQLAFITEPRKFMSDADVEEGLSPADDVEHKLRETIDELLSYYGELRDLCLLRDNWQQARTTNKDGKEVFKAWPDNLPWDAAFVWGDYLEDDSNDEQDDDE